MATLSPATVSAPQSFHDQPPHENPLRARILLVLVCQCVILFACIGVTTIIAFQAQERSIREATREHVLTVAESLAALPDVQESVTQPYAEAHIRLQAIADLMQEVAAVDYVLFTDADGRRLAHPTPEMRGRFVSTDPSGVLAGDVFIGTETGTLGPTLRAKVPIYSADGERIIGMVGVGFLEERIALDYEEAVAGLLPWVIGSVVVGWVLSVALGAVVLRRVRQLEIAARELTTQRRIADALRDQTHEFRTRLHVIRGLVAEGDSQQALDYIGAIAPVTTTASDTGGDVGDPRLRSLIEALAEEARAVGVALLVDPLTTVARDTLHDDDFTVISNLARNAVEAAFAGGHVSVFVRADSDGTHIAISDDGPGIAPADVSRIFERGFSSNGEARGVGLHLVLRVVRTRGGSVDVDQSPQGGARFIVDLPPRRTRTRAGRGA